MTERDQASRAGGLDERATRVARPRGATRTMTRSCGSHAHGLSEVGLDPVDVMRLQTAAGNRSVGLMISGSRSRPAQARTVQRFGSREHQELGDDGSGGLATTWAGGARSANLVERAPFRLTHGDITMLSGDYFDPRDTVTKDGDAAQSGFAVPHRRHTVHRPGPDDRHPGRDHLRDQEGHPGDPRFARTGPPAGGGEWADIEFSEEVKTTVDNRYLRSAADNREHFASPTGSGGGPASGLGASAGGSYRALHEDAIVRAFGAGQADGDIGDGAGASGGRAPLPDRPLRGRPPADAPRVDPHVLAQASTRCSSAT